MNYQWSVGYHAPKGISADAAMGAVMALKHPTPEELLAASKAKRHIFHQHLWAEGDQVWAQRARLTECRRIIGHIERVEVIGGKTMTVRAVEYVRGNSPAGAWATLDDIVNSPELLDAYLADAERAQQQAVEKLSRIRALIASKRQ